MPHIDLTRDDHAYFFGFFQTDGHLAAGTRNRGRASIELSAKDVELLHAFRRLFTEVHSSITTRTRATNFAASSASATWRVYAHSFRSELVALGVPTGRKSSTVAPPTVPFDARGYLRGIIDGDGSVGFTRTGSPFISLVSASQALAEFFCAQVLAVTGAIRVAKPNARDGVYAPMIASDPAAALAAWLYPDDCIALPRKLAAARDVARWERPAGMRARPESKRRWTPEEDAIALSMPIREAAARLGRSERSVNMRRWRLGSGRT